MGLSFFITFYVTLIIVLKKFIQKKIFKKGIQIFRTCAEQKKAPNLFKKNAAKKHKCKKNAKKADWVYISSILLKTTTIGRPFFCFTTISGTCRLHQKGIGCFVCTSSLTTHLFILHIEYIMFYQKIYKYTENFI